MIPKIIHYCWFGRNPKPELAKKCIRSWKKHCPDYEIIEWNEDNYDVTKIPYIKAAYDAKKWGFVTDYARLDIIFNYGGIYLDTDVEVLKSYDSLLGYSGFAGFESEKYVASGLGIGAEAGNPVIKQLMENYRTQDPFDEDGSLRLIPCPKLDTEVLCSMGLKCDGSLQMLDNFIILPTDYLCPIDNEDGILRKSQNTISIHHFAASWLTEDQQEQKQKRWKDARKEYIRYAPNRFIRKLFGDEKIDSLKRFLKK
ncbi:MAG: glycosyltransferase [Eubacteriales bacterium]|nr:glycosyltransferase [Eubacteriales bacterium]